jgi:hypothetical protein
VTGPLPSPVPTCSPISPPPSLFAIVSPDQSLATSDFDLDRGSYHWIAAALLLLVVLAICVWIARVAPRGGWRRLTVALLAVGALAVLLPAFYLLLVGGPGTKLDTRWWFSQYTSDQACLLLVNQVDSQHTQARDALNGEAGWWLLGGAVAFGLLPVVVGTASTVTTRGVGHPDDLPD